MPKPFRYLEPTFFAGLFDDPLLYVRVRPSGRALLFDCGKMHHLAKRVYTSIDAIFISHAHMDHFMGMDSVIRPPRAPSTSSARPASPTVWRANSAATTGTSPTPSGAISVWGR